jgi:hypothetical protein
MNLDNSAACISFTWLVQTVKTSLVVLFLCDLVLMI